MCLKIVQSPIFLALIPSLESQVRRLLKLNRLRRCEGCLKVSFNLVNLIASNIHRRVQFAIVILLLAALSKVEGKQISCEKKTFESWGDIGSQKTCWMKKSTKIDSSDFKIVADASVGALFFNNNKKISFLPVEVGTSFPSLKLFASKYCSIKTIAKAHFKGLKALQSLNLENNQIETIGSDTFEDLTSLKELYLSKKNLILLEF